MNLVFSGQACTGVSGTCTFDASGCGAAVLVFRAPSGFSTGGGMGVTLKVLQKVIQNASPHSFHRGPKAMLSHRYVVLHVQNMEHGIQGQQTCCQNEAGPWAARVGLAARASPFHVDLV